MNEQGHSKKYFGNVVFRPSLDLNSKMNTWSRFQVLEWLSTYTRSQEKEIAKIADAKLEGQDLASLDKDKLTSMGSNISYSLILAFNITQWNEQNAAQKK